VVGSSRCDDRTPQRADPAINKPAPAPPTVSDRINKIVRIQSNNPVHPVNPVEILIHQHQHRRILRRWKN
jgi:hypothetical protein